MTQHKHIVANTTVQDGPVRSSEEKLESKEDKDHHSYSVVLATGHGVPTANPWWSPFPVLAQFSLRLFISHLF